MWLHYVRPRRGCQVFPPDQLNALMAASDYVVLALPHTPATDKLVGRVRVWRMPHMPASQHLPVACSALAFLQPRPCQHPTPTHGACTPHSGGVGGTTVSFKTLELHIP